MATLLAPAGSAQCWQCVLPGRIVAKGQWLWRLGGAPAVTLTLPGGRARGQSSTVTSTPPAHRAAHAQPSTAVFRPRAGSGVSFWSQ